MKVFGRLMMLLIVTSQIPAAFSQGVSGTVVAGLGGYYRIGKCMPVKVHLENSGPDLAGEISIQLSKTIFSQAVSLPSPSRKTFAFYVVPPKYFNELEVKLFANGKLLKVFTSVVKRVSDEEVFIVKSSSLKQTQSLSDDSSLSEGNEKTVFIDPQNFPEFWNDYDAVNAVVLDMSDTTRLNEFQRTALSRWTLLGGNVTLSSRSQLSAPRGTPHRSSDSIGASFRTALGLGTFGEASGNKSELMPQPSLMDFDDEVFKTIRIKEPISRSGIIWGLGIFLLIYGLVVAVCLYIPKKPGTGKAWRFSIIPAAAIIFSACCPWVGQIVNGGNALVRQYSLFHIFSNNSEVFTANDLSLLFPRKGASRFTPAASSPYLLQAETENTTDAIHYEFEGKGIPSADIRMDYGRVGMLSLADFSSPGLFFVLQNAQSTTLINRSKYLLNNCSLIRNGDAITLGDLPAGKELRLKLDQVSDPDRQRSGSPGTAMLAKTINVYQAETLAGTTGDCVICGLNESIPSLKSDGMELSYSGSAAVIYHLGKQKDEKSGVDDK